MTTARRVAVLPEALANQIAAGEVVERPASVVKELVENALDASATSVFVEIEDGGRALIRVVDDGDGMAREDARLAVQRHATSKIRSSGDLAAIGTLGFRGEALPSIASVSRFELVTRPEDQAVATRVRVVGGGAPEVADAAGPVGTRVEVHELFHNVPARLKFLKRPSTEASHITGLLTAMSLGYPHVHFRMTHRGRTSLDHPRARSLQERVFQVLGAKVSEHLHEVRLDGPIRVRGYLSDPRTTRGNRTGLYTFINGRHVQDKVVSHAIVAAYEGVLPRGRYPVGVLYVHLDPQEIDVNVHPAKAEVRFVRSGAVHQAIAQAVRVTLVDAPWSAVSPTRGVVERGLDPVAGARVLPGVTERRPDGPPRQPSWLGERPSPQKVLDFGLPARPATPEMRFARLRPLGVAGGDVIVCEDEVGLVLVDRVSAAELIAIHKLRQALEAGQVPRQALLVPRQLELPPDLAAAATRHGERLGTLGLGVEPFGGPTWQLTSVPALLSRVDTGTLVTEVLRALAAEQDAGPTQATDLIVVAMARCRAVRGRDAEVGGTERLRQTLADLDACSPELRATRRLHFRLEFAELARKFQRGS